MEHKKTVLCGANAYEKKYYFNKQFVRLPEAIKEELHAICVLFTEDAGGIFTISFAEDGDVFFETNAEEHDFLYDEVSAGLLIGELRRRKQELFQSLQLYYQTFVLKKGELIP